MVLLIACLGHPYALPLLPLLRAWLDAEPDAKVREHQVTALGLLEAAAPQPPDGTSRYSRRSAVRAAATLSAIRPAGRMGRPQALVRPLSVHEVAPGVAVEGPVPEPEVREPHPRFRAERS
jgi:hypothetical protein